MAKRKKTKSSDTRATDQDEYYTQLPDIEEELKYYREQFSGKVVYCNCDDPLESNFFIYFVKNFKYLGLKKLITTCYDGSPIAGTQFELPFEETKSNPNHVAYKIEVTDVTDFSRTNRKINFWDVKDALLNGSEKARIEKLKGDGDFRSPECVELLTQSDIVCANPPPSLFPEYVAQLIEYGKEFLILGDKDAATHEAIFPLIKGNQVWFGVTPIFRDTDKEREEMFFFLPQRFTDATVGDDKLDSAGVRMVRRNWMAWFTNMDHDKRHQPLFLDEKYTPKAYPKRDDYDAIQVGKAKKIPYDYDGVIAVPVTFLYQYCPEQFEIVGMPKREDDEAGQTLKGKKKKKGIEELFIRKK